MFKRVKRNPTLSLERISDTHFRGTLKRASTFDSPFRKSKTIFEFPIEELSVIEEATRQGIEVVHPPARIHAAFTLVDVDADIDSRLYDFQRDGVQRAIALGGRCLIGDEMGCGKTIEAINTFIESLEKNKVGNIRIGRSGEEKREIKSGGGKTTFDIEFELIEEDSSKSAFLPKLIQTNGVYKKG